MSSRLKDLARLGSTLRRVRVADRALEGGGKKVWHQGDGRTEIISFVDAGGSVTRQEVYVAGRVVVWEVDRALATGLVKEESAGGDSLLLDPAVAVPSVLSALSLLEGFVGEDKYLEHLRAVLRIAAQKLPATGLDPADAAALRRVTADQPVVTPEELAAHQATTRSWAPAIVAGVVLVVALAVWLLRR